MLTQSDSYTEKQQMLGDVFVACSRVNYTFTSTSQISLGLQSGLVPSDTSTKTPSMHLFIFEHILQEHLERSQFL